MAKLLSRRPIVLLWGAFMFCSFCSRAEEVRPGILRTPDERFENLPGFDFKPHYEQIGDYRVHYLDEGPRGAEVVLMLHGEPTWSFLYRKMIPVLTEAGYRCVAPDLIGFGRSDKPVSMKMHTYKFHVDSIAALVKKLDLKEATFFGQDWGGLIGLRVVAENQERFARVVISNTGLPAGEGPPSPAFMNWRAMNQRMIDAGDIPVEQMLASQTNDPELGRAYVAPFPDPKYKAGPLIMPQLVPVMPGDPAVPDQKAAWAVLEKWEKPFLTAFGDSDPITGGGDKIFQQHVPGARGQPHTTIVGGRHFIQESNGEELALIILKFIADNPLPKRTSMLKADDIPVAHTPQGYWKRMPPPVLVDCVEPLAPSAVEPLSNGSRKASRRSAGPGSRAMISGITKCGSNCSPWPTTWATFYAAWRCRARSAAGQ